jgi:hypothetical protein
LRRVRLANTHASRARRWRELQAQRPGYTGYNHHIKRYLHVADVVSRLADAYESTAFGKEDHMSEQDTRALERERAKSKLETWLAVMLDKRQTDGGDVAALRLAIETLSTPSPAPQEAVRVLEEAWWRGRNSIHVVPPSAATAPKLQAACNNDIGTLVAALHPQDKGDSK